MAVLVPAAAEQPSEGLQAQDLTDFILVQPVVAIKVAMAEQKVFRRPVLAVAAVQVVAMVEEVLVEAAAVTELAEVAAVQVGAMVETVLPQEALV